MANSPAPLPLQTSGGFKAPDHLGYGFKPTEPSRPLGSLDVRLPPPQQQAQVKYKSQAKAKASKSLSYSMLEQISQFLEPLTKPFQAIMDG